jgi:hypothetical protein
VPANFKSPLNLTFTNDWQTKIPFVNTFCPVLTSTSHMTPSHSSLVTCPSPCYHTDLLYYELPTDLLYKLPDATYLPPTSTLYIRTFQKLILIPLIKVIISSGYKVHLCGCDLNCTLNCQAALWLEARLLTHGDITELRDMRLLSESVAPQFSSFTNLWRVCRSSFNVVCPALVSWGACIIRLFCSAVTYVTK